MEWFLDKEIASLCLVFLFSLSFYLILFIPSAPRNLSTSSNLCWTLHLSVVYTPNSLWPCRLHISSPFAVGLHVSTSCIPTPLSLAYISHPRNVRAPFHSYFSATKSLGLLQHSSRQTFLNSFNLWFFLAQTCECSKNQFHQSPRTLPCPSVRWGGRGFFQDLPYSPYTAVWERLSLTKICSSLLYL